MILKNFTFKKRQNGSSLQVKSIFDSPHKSFTSIPYTILVMGRRGSIAFLDDFRGDIFFNFLTPKDDERAVNIHHTALIFFRIFCLTFNLTSVICYKLISFQSPRCSSFLEKEEGAQAPRRRKDRAIEKEEELDNC
jgi:hypothetical protein